MTLYAENFLDKEYFALNDRNDTGDIAATLGQRRWIDVSLQVNF
jgi:hypothetical protein